MGVPLLLMIAYNILNTMIALGGPESFAVADERRSWNWGIRSLVSIYAPSPYGVVDTS